jgi:hypothetical protein
MPRPPWRGSAALEPCSRDTRGLIFVAPPDATEPELAWAEEIRRAWEVTPHGTGLRASNADGRAFHALFDQLEFRAGAAGPHWKLAMLNLVAALGLREQYRRALARGDFDLALLSVQAHSRAEALRHWRRRGLDVRLKDKKKNKKMVTQDMGGHVFLWDDAASAEA